MEDRTRARWIQVLRNLKPEEPPPEGLYVEPRHGCAAAVVQDIEIDPTAYRKYLLVGAWGGGKSSELRAIGRKLRGKAQLVTIDLDRSGVLASSVSAFDLLYVSALGLLRKVPDVEQAKGLFTELRARYAGEEAESLGELTTSWSGLADFTGAAATIASGVGAAATTLGIDMAGASTAAHVLLAAGSTVMSGAGMSLRLRSKPAGLVAETSPAGRALQEVCNKIVRVCREASELPLCVLVDGLEKMNGEAGERFRQMFESTRLLADARWTSVIAAPPCTLTETNSVDGRGFSTRPVWGFGPDDYGQLRKLLELRLYQAEVDPERDVGAGELDRIAESSGGMPRHAVLIAQEAVKRALGASSPKLERHHVDEGIRAVAELLARGLNAEHLSILSRVKAKGVLPGDEGAPTLFANGRILAYPPTPPGHMPRFVVHPLLVHDVEQSAS